ncbi:stationary-phase survival protein SurE [Methylorubrum populi BJ001]|jgi:5'-nucleotidase|uniref:5'-nucleotidase SurE n=1 Tax=Methylorubrum populi (strain ATCC BAA-705 / NCIMB 13946 / BJ001) TaxID=441620 RepID=SURE_METPB|nr:5'/3'-nucleotidase SurE [Methylorubrum populi]B1ZJ09.1 RecName: Full=5'-nucleotidase SurE; AltName: Full=Nucleoside 5'-monophosphate phosphohydrolase [Methylorubrum populi BJ001]ACB82848.1 stationary-phase survival protein SurE [Methylorubrum populi BJ001]OAH26823.1 5'/3'-nucleotidase SurE [Methylorubrum populi]PZP68929.1 MAG: 5'-nucleotidase SurE [Methylorubrum populi]
MRILVTNDDGIHAPGLETLQGIARELSDDVWVVAPEYDQSGVSHSLSLNDPLRLRQVSEKRFAVKGTPSDCVIMGVSHILKDHRPDLVLSGVNRGQNVAEDVTYSGTIAGAMEGTILGIRAIALSQAYGAGGRANLKWSCAAAHGAAVIRKILEIGIEPGILVNVNFPDCEPEEVQGVAVSAQGQRNQALLQIDARHDGRGNPYFWLAFAKARFEPGNGTDLKAIAENRIAVTPLRLDLTDEPELTRFAAAFRA